MRGIIDRITNRDLVSSLQSDTKEQKEVIHDLKLQLVEFDTIKEKADNLANVVNVLKMRFDILMPINPSTVEQKDNEVERPVI